MADDGLHLYGFEGAEDKAVPLADAVNAGLAVVPVSVPGTAATRGVLEILPELIGTSASLALYFGVKADAVLASNGTATGTDNGGPLNAYAAWCRDLGRVFTLPPGDYLTTQAVSVWTDVEAAGARIIRRYAKDAIAVSVENMPGDVTTIPVSEVNAWTGWKRRAKKLAGLNGRRGEYIAAVTGEQVLLPRMDSPQWRPGTSYAVNARVIYQGRVQTCSTAHTSTTSFDQTKWSAGAVQLSFAEGFRVSDDDGTLAHMLYGDANNAAWTSGDFTSKKIRHPITVSGLRIVFAKPIGTPAGIAGSGVTNARPNTRFVGCQVENVSGLEVAQGFVDDVVCDVTHIGGFVRGLFVNATNYGWNSNFAAGLIYDGCRQEFCRRGIDANRSKHISILNCELPDGWGAHWGAWMGSNGGSIGASTANNPQALNLSGIGFYAKNHPIALTEAATAVARLRSDITELGDALVIDNCPISVNVPAARAFICDLQGLAAGFDALRPIEFPRLVSVENCPIEVRGETTILRILKWGVGWTSDAQPQPVVWNSRFSWQRSPVFFPEGGPVGAGGALRVEIETSKPTLVTGSGLRLDVSGLPVLSLSMTTASAVYDTDGTTLIRAEGATATGRVNGRITGIDGLAFVKYFYGAFSDLFIDAGSLNHSPVSAAPNRQIGDERVRTPLDPADPLDASVARPAISARYQAGLSISGVVFGRTTNGSYFDARGTLLTAPAGAPRFAHDPATGESRGLLIEGGGNNYLANSASPATQTISLGAGTFTLSVAGSGSAVLSGGAAGTATQGAPVTFTLSASANVTVTRSGALTRFQLENGGLATSFIATAADPATRAIDTYSYPLPANVWNTLEGTFVLDAFAAAGNGGLLQQAWEFGDSTGGNRLLIARDANKNVGVSLLIGGTNYPIVLGTPWLDDTRLRIAVTVGGGSMAVSINGAPITTASAPGLPPATRMRVGDGATGNRPWNGSILSIDYIPRRVANAALPVMARPTNQGQSNLPAAGLFAQINDKVDAALGSGQVPYDFPTIADAVAASIPVGQRVVRLAGAVVAGTGPASYVESATTGAGPGRWQSSPPNARWWQIVNAGSLSLEQLGALPGNTTAILAANLAAVQAAAQLTKTVRLDIAITVAATADMASYMDLTIYGRGKIDGLYRKYVIGDSAVSAVPQMAGDLSSLESCQTSCRTRAAIEVLIGDSISSYSANNNARSSMISTVLERAVRSQARQSGRSVAFYNRALGGQSWATLADKPTTSMDRVIAWYPDRTRRWLDVVKDLAPTRVFISFGMNDLAGISATAVRNVVNEIKTWSFGTGADAYTTDIVVLTNLVPRPYVGPLLPSNGPWNTQATQEGADRAAGFIRTFAKRFGLGLLDIHRMCCRARDGFDPTEGAMVQVRDSVVTANGATGTRAVYGHKTHFRVDPTKFASDGTSNIAHRHGAGDADLFIMTKTTVTDQYQIVVLSGDAGNQIAVSGPTLVTIPPPSDQAFELVFEKTGNLGFLYLAGLTFSGGYGESAPNIWSGDLVSRGGLYTPSIATTATGAIFGIGFDYMTPTICRPATDATTLFGTGDGTFPPEGGSGYNHPSVNVEPYVYAPVIGAARLYDGDPLRLLAGQPVRWLTAAGVVLGYLTTDTAGALTFTDGAGAISKVVGGAWTTYTPTYTATNGGTVTFTPQRTSYEVVGKTLRIQGQFQVTSTSAIAFLDVSLPPGISLKHGCTGIAANLGNGTATTATGLQGQTALRINGGAAFYGTTGGTIGFNATVEIA